MLQSIHESMISSYSNHIKNIRNAYKAYMLDSVQHINNKVYLPITLKEYFKYITFNDDEDFFIFVLNNNPTEIIQFYVNVNEYSNFLNDRCFCFDLVDIEYYYQNSNDIKILKLRAGIRKGILKSVFDLLNTDGSLQTIYKKYYHIQN